MRFTQFCKVFILLIIIMKFGKPGVHSHSDLYTHNVIHTNEVMLDLTKKVKIGPVLAHFDKQFSRCGINQIDIRELSIVQVQQYFRNGKLSSTGLTLCYLKRILVMNPYLKAVIEINPDAIKIAIKSDMQRMLGIIQSPLHGIPILIKDNMATFDKMQTTIGSEAMQYLLPLDDADVIKRLREAGAVILGKSNPSEWADFRGTNIPGGWSGRGGQTRSPYVLSSDPSGSSTGSAVGVAANLAMVAVGTETDGSIISPSSLGSLVGLKPTLGCISTQGIIPLSSSQDVIGPITRSVSDAQIVLDVISNEHFCQKRQYKLECKQCAYLPYRIGAIRNPFWNSSDPILMKVIPQLNAALKVIQENQMVTVIDPAKEPRDLLEKLKPNAELTVLYHEFKYGINKYLNEVKHFEYIIGRRIRTLADIIQFNKNNGFEEYNQDYLIASEATNGINNLTYQNIRDHNKATTREYITKALDENDLDAIVGPCNSKETLLIHNTGSIAGYPSITVPVGVDKDGIPFGICFLGRANSERVLLEIASLFEKKLTMRRMPGFYN